LAEHRHRQAASADATFSGGLPPDHLVTSRGALLRKIRRLGVSELSLSADRERRFNHDLELFAAQRITSGLRERISPALGEARFALLFAERADGNFLYARYLLAMIEASADCVDERALRAIPSSLDGIYVEYLERIAPAVSDAWSDRLGPLLGTLSVALEAVTEAQLAAWVQRPQDEVRVDLVRLRPVLKEPPGDASTPGLYTLYHRSFADFLLDDARAEEFWCPSEAQHRRIAAWYLRQHAHDWRECDGYGLAHLVSHLYAAGEHEQLLEVLRAEFLSAKAAQKSSLSPVLQDLRVGLQAALKTVQPATALGLVAAQALLKRRVRDLPPGAIPLYAAAGEIDHALELAGVIEQPLTARITLRDVIQRIRERDPNRAAAVVGSLPDPEMRAFEQLAILETSASQLADDTLSTACFKLADAIEPVTRAEWAAHALMRLARLAHDRDSPLRTELLDRAKRLLCQGDDAVSVGQAWAALAREFIGERPAYAAELFERAVLVVASDREDSLRAVLAAGFVDELAAIDERLALEVAQKLQMKVARAHALIRLVQLACAREQQAPDFLEDAQEAVDDISLIWKYEAKSWQSEAEVWLATALIDTDLARSLEILQNTGITAVHYAAATALKSCRFTPSRVDWLAALLDDAHRDVSLLSQGRLQLSAGDIEAALSVAELIGGASHRCTLLADSAKQLAASGATPRAREIARRVEQEVANEVPQTIFEVALPLAAVDREIALRLLEVAITAVDLRKDDPPSLLAGAELALALGDKARGLELVRSAVRVFRADANGEWLAVVQRVVLRDAAQRNPAEAAALRNAINGGATDATLTGAVIEGTASRDLDEAIAMLPQVAEDHAGGHALAAIVLAAAEQADPRTYELMTRFLAWNGRAWYDVKSNTAARAATRSPLWTVRRPGAS
jgi:hypothetical protein